MLETILAAVAGIVALLGGKLWWVNRKADKAEAKIGAIDLAEKIYVEKARAKIAAAKSAKVEKPDVKRRDDFEGAD